jgi:TonB family protein
MWRLAPLFAALLIAPASPSSAAPVPPAAPEPLANPDWEELPTADQMTDAYPAGASAADLEGEVVLKATSDPVGRLLDCKVQSEVPVGQGFGEAALKLCPYFKLRAPAGGRYVAFGIRFRLPPDDDCVASFTAVAGEASEPKAVRCPPADYAEASRAAGHQGVAVVKATIGGGGEVLTPQVVESSGAPELDAAALAAVGRWRFEPGRDANGQGLEVPVEVKISFVKDSVDTVARKTCADFVTDASWFAQTFPGHKRAEMPLYSMASQLYVNGTMAKGMPIEVTLKIAKRLPVAFDQTYIACAANPDANFLVTLRDRIQKGL